MFSCFKKVRLNAMEVLFVICKSKVQLQSSRLAISLRFWKIVFEKLNSRVQVQIFKS